MASLTGCRSLRRRILGADGDAFRALPCCPCALAPAYWVIVACAVLFGLSAGAIDAALNSYAARHFGPRQINLMHAAYGLGAATSPLIVTLVVSSGTNWRWAYLVVMFLQGLLAVLFAASSRRWNQARTNEAAPVSTSSHRPERRRWHLPPRAVAGLLLAAVDCALESVVGLWAFVFLFEEVTLPPSIAGAVVSG